MANVTSKITRITRIHCAQRECEEVYDYMGPKSPNGAAAEAVELGGWGQHITGQMQCPKHAGGVLVTSMEPR